MLSKNARSPGVSVARSPSDAGSRWACAFNQAGASISGVGRDPDPYSFGEKVSDDATPLGGSRAFELSGKSHTPFGNVRTMCARVVSTPTASSEAAESLVSRDRVVNT